MVLVYCAKDKQKQAEEALNLSGKPHEFASPTSTGVNYYATQVFVVGSHPSIEKRYRGIVPIESVDIDEPEDSEE